MEALDVTINANWVLGLLLATTRVSAFAVASPQLGTVIPVQAKLAFAFAIGWFLAGPVTGVLTVERLIALAIINATIGVVMGWMVGVLFHMFSIAGTMIDTTSGTAIASVLDPTRGEQGAVFSRLFQVGGLAMFYALGGLSLLVSTLVWSVRAVPLGGSARFDGGALAGAAVSMTSKVMVAGLEIAMPVLAVMLLAELVLGLAARFAPTANVFLLGLPAKTYIAIVTAAMSIALFPEAIQGLMDFSRQTAVEVLNGIGVPAA